MFEGTKRDAFHVPMQFELVKWLCDRIEAGDDWALPAFTEAMESWSPNLKRNVRNLKALWILSKYYKLVGNMDESDHHHARLVDLHSRGIER